MSEKANTTKKNKFFEIANKNFIMLFIAYTVICVAHSMTQATASAGWKDGHERHRYH